MIAGPYQSPRPVLLGERARTAAQAARCAVCSRTVRPGQRVANLPGGGPAHLHPCIVQSAGIPR